MSKCKSKALCNLNFGFDLAGKCPEKLHLAGGVKGHNVDDISLPGSAVLWAESFTFEP
jgi:hypothetical protein